MNATSNMCLVGQSVDFSPWLAAPMIGCRYNPRSVDVICCYWEDPSTWSMIAANAMWDYPVRRTVEDGSRKRWWFSLGGDLGWRRVCELLQDAWLRKRGVGVFKVWQLLRDRLKETALRPDWIIGTPTISWSACRLSLPDWTCAMLHNKIHKYKL